MKKNYLNYRTEIDGLRAIAVFSVIFYHTQISMFNYEPFKGGFIGVDIFFVISGYLITSIILKEIYNTGTFSFKYFYERRIRRIIPPLIFVIICSLPLAWLYLLPESIVLFSKSVLYSLGFFSNYFFLDIGTQYGAPDTLYLPMLHTWSLAVEEQFYILFPIFIIFVVKLFKRKIILVLILILLFLASLFLAEVLSRSYPSLSFYILPTRIFEIIAGSLISYFQINYSNTAKSKILNWTMPKIGLVLILFSVYYFDNKIFHPSSLTLIPIFGVLLIIWYSNKDELVHRLLSTKFLVYLGLISYSLYLWHYPVFAFARKTEFIMGDPSKKILIALIIFILSLISYYCIEKPSRNQNYKFRIIFLPILVSSIILIFLNINVIKNNGYENRVPEILKTDFNEPPWRMLKTENNKDCHDWIKGCVFYSYKNKRIVNIIGDSQMGSLSYGLKNIAVDRGYTFKSYTVGACGYYPGFDLIDTKTQKKDLNCNNEYFSQLKTTLNKQRNSILIFGANFQTHIDNLSYIKDENNNERKLEKWNKNYVKKGKFLNVRDSFTESIIKLSKKNKIILIYPIPEIEFNLREKINLFSKNDSNNLDNTSSYITTSYLEYKNRTKSSFEFLDKIKGENVYRIYPHNLFCGTLFKDKCISHDDKNLFYHDSIHLSLSGSKLINELIINKIEELNKIF